MNNGSTLSILSISLILISSCTIRRVDGPAQVPRFSLTGINGTATYHISSTKGVVLVIKDEYTRPGEYIISIVRDTLTLDKEFIADFYITNPKFKITISEPRTEVIEGGASMQDPESFHKKFAFKTKKLGMHSLKGQLEYDSLVVPFEYKFIVVPQK